MLGPLRVKDAGVINSVLIGSRIPELNFNRIVPMKTVERVLPKGCAALQPGVGDVKIFITKDVQGCEDFPTEPLKGLSQRRPQGQKVRQALEGLTLALSWEAWSGSPETGKAHFLLRTAPRVTWQATTLAACASGRVRQDGTKSGCICACGIQIPNLIIRKIITASYKPSHYCRASL